MLVLSRRVPTLVAAMALGVVTAAGTAVAGAAPSDTGPAASPLPTTATQISTLPDGDRVLVTGSGPEATTAVLGPDGRSVSSLRYAPDGHHTYVIPDSVLAAPDQFVASRYRIAALSTGSSPTVVPHYPLSTLQINGVGLDGTAADGMTFLTDVDDVNRWGLPVPLVNGVARVAVPAGHYTANTMFQSYDPTTQTAKTWVVTQLDVTVTGDGTTTLTADERSATAQVQATTPRPATNDSSFLYYDSVDANGSDSYLMSSSVGTGTTYVSPTAKPRFGGFKYQLVGWGAAGPAGTADPYRYDVMFPAADHIDANQTYKVAPSTLTTVHNTLVSDPNNPDHRGIFMAGPSSPDFLSNVVGGPVTSPGSLTEYVGAVGDGNWIREVVTDSPPYTGGFPSELILQATDPAYAGHTETWRTWGRGPLTPQAGQYQGPIHCRACADGGTVDLSLTPYQDSSPDTLGDPLGPITGHFTAYRDGNQVFSQDNTFGTELTGQAQQPGTYRFVYDQDLSQFPITQSTVSHTDITVPYTPAPDPKWTLPAVDPCYAQGTGTTPCSILPVINLDYHLATDDTNTGHGPLAALDLQVGHQSYNGAGATAAATGATVSVSYDKGVTWTAASVVPAGANHFVALWKNGAKGSTPWLKVTATDTLGGSITQTVANAYTIG
ncbi:hypothetical protein KGQ20_37255 [Catenulispora sp. NF23]|uniref:hypothetical protein n=1 Tax=Catenulispora pinistramenti TaxID=2705254 RepID=UPI001BA7C566|nr:hypothetical protein [Catenulispora pinistramenti]MBS2538413.1 hypothetical protein [Catenulispora pinistramenti]